MARIRHAHIVLPAAAGQPGHTRSVVLSACCLLSVVCDLGKKNSETPINTSIVRKNSLCGGQCNDGWHISFCSNGRYIPSRMLRAMNTHTPAAHQKGAVWSDGKLETPTKHLAAV